MSKPTNVLELECTNCGKRFDAAFEQHLCACGKPLHYTDRTRRSLVEETISRMGPLVTVTCGTRSWKVPRHFIALHGLVAAAELPELAKKYGFEEIKSAS